MTINRQKLSALVFVLSICGWSASAAFGQQASAPRSQPPSVIKYDGDMASILGTLPDIYGVSIGFEVDPQQPKPQVGFYLLDPTLSDVLNAIIQSAPRYQWRESGGFIEVLPLEGSSPLLDTPIRKFLVNDVDNLMANNRLVQRPEVQASIRAMSLNRRDLGLALREKRVEKFSLSLEDVTMRQALNAIAKESGARFWIFRRDNNGFFSISN